MRELTVQEMEVVDGGIIQILGAALVLYGAADIAYEFGKGFWEAL